MSDIFKFRALNCILGGKLTLEQCKHENSGHGSTNSLPQNQREAQALGHGWCGKSFGGISPADAVSWQYWIPLNKNLGRAQDLAQLRDRQLRCNGLKHSVLNRWPDVPAGLKGSLASTEHPGEVSAQGVGRSSCTSPPMTAVARIPAHFVFCKGNSVFQIRNQWNYQLNTHILAQQVSSYKKA